jgi:polyphosphate kinase 2 (PPK2 family)
MADQEQAVLKKLRVEPGEKIRLRDRNPRDKSLFGDEQETKAATAALAKDIDTLQDRLYAEGSRALLVILQGTDTSGKDGTIRSVFNATGPLGVSVHAFGPPSRPPPAAAPSASSTDPITRTF